MVTLYSTVGTVSTYLNDSSHGTYATVATETSAGPREYFAVENHYNRSVAEVYRDAAMERALVAVAAQLAMNLFLSRLCWKPRDEVVLFRISDRRPKRPRNTWD